MKKCFKCGIVKPLSEFYKHSAMSAGVLSKCKECTKADVRRNYRANREYYREYEKGRAMLPHRIEARTEYSKTSAGVEAHMRAYKKYNRSPKKRNAIIKYIENHPERRAAHVAVGNALRDGRLEKQPCETCESAIVQAHHEDYAKPLQVRWLCKTHHDIAHRESRELAIEPERD